MDPEIYCPSDQFKYKINFWCLGHGRYVSNSAEAASIVFSVLNSIILFMALYLIKYSRTSIKRLVEPSTQTTQNIDETYCIISYYILKVTQLYLGLISMMCLYNTVAYALGEKYQHYFCSNSFINCDPQDSIGTYGIPSLIEPYLGIFKISA